MPAGRPSKMNDATLKKLEDGFLLGLSDREACIYADIAPQTLYNYCNDHPEYLERKELLKENLKMQAKINIAHEIKSKDTDTSKWYLERKAKDEFSTKQEHTVEGEMTNYNYDMSKLNKDQLQHIMELSDPDEIEKYYNECIQK